MLSYSRAVLVGLVCALVAACSSGSNPAGAQDLGIAFLDRTPPPAKVPPVAPPSETAGFVSGQNAVLAPPPGGRIPSRVTRAILPSDPLRIMVVGDSLADGFGIFMKPVVQERGLPISVVNRGKTSTGLARADFYNWPANFNNMAATTRPDVVVVHFGANDDQPLRRTDGSAVPFNTPEWEAAYREEARKILDTAAAYGAVVYWLGPAPDRNPRRNALLTRANGYFREEAAQAGAYFISLPAFTAGPSGEFVMSANGTTIRAADGSHFTVAGYRMVVDRILRAIERDNPGIFSGPAIEVARLQ